MDKVDYLYNNFHLLGIQVMQKNTISAILKRPKFFNSIKSNKKNILLKSASKILSYGPLKVLGFNTRRISKGPPADFTIINIEKSWIVNGNNMLSLSSNSCFEGMPMQGKVLSCWKDGIEIYQCN